MGQDDEFVAGVGRAPVQTGRVTAARSDAPRRVLPRAAAVMAVVGLLLAACGDTDSDRAAALDLDTLQAQTQAGAVQAQRADQSFVSALGEGQAIGVAFADDIGAEALAGDPNQIVVYLYDREDFTLLVGEVDPTGAATLTSVEQSAFDATVELAVEGDTVSGTVSIAGGQPSVFTAPTATGVAGVYWAKGTGDDAEVSCEWVVLDDGRQWGCICVMPPMMPEHPCCMVRFMH
jgi:hypothetical protein